MANKTPEEEEQELSPLTIEEMSYGQPIELAPEPLKYQPVPRQWEPDYIPSMLFRLCAGSALFSFGIAWVLFWREE